MAFDFPASPVENQIFAPPGGPLYTFKNPAWMLAGIDSTPAEWVMNVQVITSSGTYTKPANLAYLEVTCVGGGGGGASSNTCAAAQASCGGGGGGGGTAVKLFKASDLPASLTLTVPSGAIGQVTPGAGGTAQFGVLMSASGGLGGVNVAPRTTTTIGGGGAGGGSSGGDINISGERGGYGWTFPSGVMTLSQGGDGGGSWLGVRHRGSVSSSQITGSNGPFPGAGGAGGATTPSNAAGTGGDGAAGCIILREYYPQWVLDAAYPPGTINTTVWTASGTYTKPAGLKFLEIEGVGPGGGSTACAATTASQTSTTGGGAGGGYGKQLFKAADLPASVAITIGAVGAAGSGGATAGAGSTSSFGALCTFAGGGGGQFASASAAISTAPGGSGGSATGCDFAIQGQNGGRGVTMSTTIFPIRGHAGGSFFALPGAVCPGTLSGSTGRAWGGGAEGSANYTGQPTGTGAAGGPSMIKITEYF